MAHQRPMQVSSVVMYREAMAGQVAEERAIVLPDWPQPAVVGSPRISADDSSLLIRYRTPDDKIVVVRFPLCNYVVFGAPNDEALNGHPLYSRGLKFYSVHEVLHSSTIEMLVRRNSVHPRHDPDLFQDMRHYIFTFQDSTLECVVSEGQWWKATIRVCGSESEADEEWHRTSDA
jgi:hypothetical protein